MDQNLQTPTETTATDAVPAGYERRDVIWPTDNERISVLLPIPKGTWVE